MSDIQFVTADKIKTLEHYAASLISAMVTLRTLESFHIAAYNVGLLDEGEAETGQAMLWDLQRLQKLYRTQMDNILERVDISEQQIIDSLAKLMPEIKTPRKKKSSKQP